MGDQISKNPEPQFNTVQELIAFKKGRRFAPGHNTIFACICVGFVTTGACLGLYWANDYSTWEKAYADHVKRYPAKPENVEPIPLEQRVFIPSIIKKMTG